MMQGKTLNDLATELERQSKSKQDFKAPLLKMDIVPHLQHIEDVVENPQATYDLKFKLDGIGEFHMTSHFHDQIGQFTGIPSKYYDRMLVESPDLLAKNLNHWLVGIRDSKTGASPTKLVRTLDKQARAFLSNRYRTIDNWDVAEVAIPTLLKHECEVVSSNVDYNRMFIKAVTPKITIKVKKGDVVQCGLVVSNSEVGQGAVKVEFLLYRLACLNGMIIPDSGLRRFHIGRISEELDAAAEVFRDETRQADDKAFMMKFVDVINAGFDQTKFDVIANTILESDQREMIAPPDQVVEEVVSQWHLKEEDKSSILSHLIKGGSITQWGLANAVTATANDQVVYDKATSLERIGGEIMMLPPKEWKNLAA
jgi:hypothetical protein